MGGVRGDASIVSSLLFTIMKPPGRAPFGDTSAKGRNEELGIASQRSREELYKIRTRILKKVLCG
jgi:hypothetical protein